MTDRSLQALIDDAVAACRKPMKSGFDPSAVVVCPPKWIHVLEQKLLAELQHDIEAGHCAVISAEGLLLDFWNKAEGEGALTSALDHRVMGRLMNDEEGQFPDMVLAAILEAFQAHLSLRTCVVTGLWVFYPAIHTSSILSDLKNRNLGGQVIFLYPGVDVDGVFLKLLGIDEGFGYKARRI